ncbi:BQ5605_C013g07196 [Microbotryum silenes-dioicae]|uniref:BQ5605_C013g07196 protein n=1 Tax=Microbotryum silenes-dioicae TaxID=796604 RepID=A0A2X0MKK0_9BASI|nr:BQ5605_C013g07196 [Microbotryum silenes-dioicae]
MSVRNTTATTTASAATSSQTNIGKNRSSSSTIIAASTVASFIVLLIASILLFFKITKILRSRRELKRRQEALRRAGARGVMNDADLKSQQRARNGSRRQRNAFEENEWEGTPPRIGRMELGDESMKPEPDVEKSGIKSEAGVRIFGPRLKLQFSELGFDRVGEALHRIWLALWLALWPALWPEHMGLPGVCSIELGDRRSLNYVLFPSSPPP